MKRKEERERGEGDGGGRDREREGQREGERGRERERGTEREREGEGDYIRRLASNVHAIFNLLINGMRECEKFLLHFQSMSVHYFQQDKG